MVLSMWILGSTCLSAHFYSRKIGKTTCTACHCHAHSFGHILEVLTVNRRYALLQILRRHYSVLDCLDDMWRYEPSSVGYRGTQVGYLKRSGKDLALAYGY